MISFDPLFIYINNHATTPLSEEDKALLQVTYKPKKLKKKQYFLQEGDICKHVGFVIKGALRLFSVDEKGHEHVIRFSVENWWTGNYESFMMKTPSQFHVEALEDCELLLVSYEQVQMLTEKIPAYAEMLKKLEIQGVIAQSKRIHASISLSAEERYQNLMNTYPEFIQRFPRNLIASYLGITPETLSRIRKQALHK